MSTSRSPQKHRLSIQLPIGIAAGVLLSIATILMWDQFVRSDRSDSSEFGTEVEGSMSESINAPQSADAGVFKQYDLLPVVWNSIAGVEQREIAEIVRLVEVAKDTWSQSGIAVLNRMWDTLADPSVRKIVAQSVLIEALQRDGHQSTFEEAWSLHDEVRDWALRKITESWVQEDANQVMNAVSSVESQRIRSALQEVVAIEWAKLDPKGVLSSLTQLPQNVRYIGEEEAMLEIARTTPLEALHFFEDQFNVMESDRESLLAQELARSWSEFDPDAALEWAGSQEFSKRQTRFDVVSIVLRKLAQTRPQHALDQIQQDFGGDTIADGLNLAVIDEVASNHSTTAIELLDRVNTTSAYSLIGRQLVQDQHYGMALDLGARVDQDQRQHYFATIMTRWAHTRPFSLLDSLDGLPTEEVKSIAAFNLMQHYLNRRSLSEEQVLYASSFLSDDHAHQLQHDFGGGNLASKTNYQVISNIEVQTSLDFGDDSNLSDQIEEILRKELGGLTDQ